ncbi:hypothetical protein [Paraburkholderia fynbosensis]|uniref:hypothetical protein n=1 Tax=Paraburkholderia fynbosensis TaxID=1200993 RepID=UPI0015813B91|nr:hypothetical protein [Paraburkholderia fynbosensis]
MPWIQYVQRGIGNAASHFPRMSQRTCGVVPSMNNGDRYARQRRQNGNEIHRVLAAKRFDHRTLPQPGRIAAYVFQQEN